MSTVTSLCSINLTSGVWSVTGSIFYAAGSGTVRIITCVYASISTSATVLDTTYSTRTPSVNYSFGTTANTYLNIAVTRYVATTSNQTYCFKRSIVLYFKRIKNCINKNLYYS